MSANWPIVLLGDCCQKIGSGATPTGGSSVYLDQGEICLIRSQNVHNDSFKPDGLVFITADAANKLKNVIVEKNDILLNITGDSVARVCLAPEEFLPARVNQHVAIIRPGIDEFDPRYLRYLLVSPAMQNFLLTIAAVGATRNALTKNMIESLEVSKPPMQVQIAIAEQLESLDKKIHLNAQTNQTLESIAQAIFKSWFVDFEPVKAKMAAKERWYALQPTSDSASPVCYADEAALPDLETYTNLAAMCTISGKTETELAQLQQQNPDHYQQLAETAALFPSLMVDSELGEIPEGWEVATLGDLANLNEKSWTAKNAPSEIRYVDLANTKWGVINSVESFDYSSAPSRARRVLRRNDTIIGTVRPRNGSYAFVKASNFTGSTGFAVLSPKQEIFAELIYIAATTSENLERLAHLADGGAYPAVRPEVIMGTSIVLPTKKDNLQDICLMFSKSTALLFEKIFTNQEENTSLAELRDSLLPKLLSGEIDLTNLQSEAMR